MNLPERSLFVCSTPRRRRSPSPWNPTNPGFPFRRPQAIWASAAKRRSASPLTRSAMGRWPPGKTMHASQSAPATDRSQPSDWCATTWESRFPCCPRKPWGSRSVLVDQRNPAAVVYALDNASDREVNWSGDWSEVSATPSGAAWLTLDGSAQGGGTVAGAGQAAVLVAIDPVIANQLPPGTHTAEVRLTNLCTGFVHRRSVTLGYLNPSASSLRACLFPRHYRRAVCAAEPQVYATQPHGSRRRVDGLDLCRRKQSGLRSRLREHGQRRRPHRERSDRENMPPSTWRLPRPLRISRWEPTSLWFGLRKRTRPMSRIA